MASSGLKQTGGKKKKRDDAPGLFDAPDAEPQPKPARPDSPPATAAVTSPPAPAPAEPDAAERAPKSNGQPRKRTNATAESMAAKQRDISVSEFFAKNRHLLGFDNKRKSLLTTVKEAVDNSLDACEEAGILPEIHIGIEQLAEERFRVTVRDNGPGIVKAQIPNIFGKLLYGSKFHRLKMSRGQQGIGISAAGMYGLLTTGKPIHITSRISDRKPAHHFQIAIDTTKNRPDVVVDEEQDVEWERGTEVRIELVASYAKGRQSVDEYIEQTAIANPHARFVYRLLLAGNADAPPAPVVRDFPRASGDLPAETCEIQPHPHGIELGVLMKMLKEAGIKGSRDQGNKGASANIRTLSSFLQYAFCRVSTKVAHEICDTAKLSHSAKPAALEPQEAERLYQSMQSVRIMAPPTDCLAPIGVRALLNGLTKELKAEFYTATTRDPAVYRGNPFQIEVGLAFGGQLPADEPARVIRFANRVPLLYQQSGCAAFKSVLDVDWRNYGVSQPGGSLPVAPLVVMVHMASVWVPFTSESKEAIADYDEIRKEMKLSIQECGRKLAAYVRKRRRQRLEGERRSIFERYIEDVSEALFAISGAAKERLMKELQAIARERTAEADVELDEDGKPIEKAADADDELVADESTVIVKENEAVAGSAELFDAAEPPPASGRERGPGQNAKRKRAR
ncbi:DNA topoisomerase VI subunit B [Phycisphaerae bacterium RAS1]|nr:DNA topoisomerase VI subunit B [Phycisphaerae bacterium RAS1]